MKKKDPNMKSLDLCLVVGMFLTGFDSKKLNTLYVDKNMEYHGLLQAFSRTNRILNEKKRFGKVICFRDMKANVDAAIKLFSNSNNPEDIVRPPFETVKKEYVKLAKSFLEKYPSTATIDTLQSEKDKKDFVLAFRDIIRKHAEIQIYDDYDEDAEDLGITEQQYMDFRAFKLLSADEGTNTVELEELTTSIEAGTPVIIKMNEGTTSLSFSVENTAIAKDIQTAATADGSYQLQGLYAQKEFSKDVDNNCYIVKGNQLMNPAKLLANTNVTKVASKPFRAYMVDNTSTPAAGAKMFSIGFNDNTTAIDNLNTIANDKAVYYDIQGLRLNAPQKGINIVKRGNKTMKVIIK